MNVSKGSSETTSTAALDAIRETLTQFQSDCAEWQSEVEDFFDDLEAYVGRSDAEGSPCADLQPTSEQLDRINQTAIDERQQLLQQQSRMAEELETLRGLVEQQTDLVNSWMQQETEGRTDSDEGNGSTPRGDSRATDRVVEQVLEKLEQLERAGRRDAKA
jgi:DNA repair ATPase RecN